MTARPVDLKVDVEYLTRVEGHGNIRVETKDGKLTRCEWNVVEPPRFFEAFLRGRSWQESALITSRICGICSTGHQLTSLKATEAAFGIEPSEQTILLRKLICDAATLQSHILHVYFLVSPDLLGVPSVIPLTKTHPDVVARALRLKKLANDVTDIVGGRAVHPVTMIPGGFTKVPTPDELKGARERLEAAIEDIVATAKLVRDLAGKIPAFERETEYIGLRMKGEYALYDGDVFSSDDGAHPVPDYLKVTNEKVAPHSTAKHASFHRNSYMVGALARLNINFDLLDGVGAKAAEILGFRAPVHNPYYNSVAQVIESALVIGRMIHWIDELLAMGPKPEPRPKVKPRAARGIGSTEVPRGILFHDYTYDADGRVVDANCVIPTNQNCASIEDDMRSLVPKLIEDGRSRDEITFALEVLVRAYDPCISCSVH
ncbi:MAG: Ni/Fe hydrogenase subunit alpha [Planctomycetes bacterium]|nr:Ni/Fe hydrogenase subunit alpha [Planctomycetota bacterium]